MFFSEPVSFTAELLSIEALRSLHVQRCDSGYVPFDHLLRALHLCEELGISYDPCCILNFSTSLVQSGDDTYNRSFQNVSQICNSVERHSSRPFIDDFD